MTKEKFYDNPPDKRNFPKPDVSVSTSEILPEGGVMDLGLHQSRSELLQEVIGNQKNYTLFRSSHSFKNKLESDDS